MAPAPSEAAIKERIVTHMNNDHMDSVQRYVENYNGASRSVSRSARLVDITNTEMTIAAAGTNYRVPFRPPMKSLSDARARVVQMDADCIRDLGRSPYTVTEFARPSLVSHVLILFTIGAAMIIADEKYVLPGSVFYEGYLRFVPYMPYIFKAYRQWIGGFFIVTHAVEAYVMSGKLEKHSTPLYSRAWYLWILSALFIGFPTFQSLNALVEKKRIAKEKAKH